MMPPDAPALSNDDGSAAPRPGGLTAYLAFLLLCNIAGVVVFPVIGAAINGLGASDAASTVFSYAPTVLAAANIACLIGLFKNKRWGFWGLCVTSVLWVPVTAVLGAGIGGLGFGAVGLAAVGVLYALLNAGTPNARIWPRLH